MVSLLDFWSGSWGFEPDLCCRVVSVDVVAQFYPWFNFYFPLFLCMVVYDNEYKTKGNWTTAKTRIKLNCTLSLFSQAYEWVPVTVMLEGGGGGGGVVLWWTSILSREGGVDTFLVISCYWNWRYGKHWSDGPLGSESELKMLNDPIFHFKRGLNTWCTSAEKVDCKQSICKAS